MKRRFAFALGALFVVAGGASARAGDWSGAYVGGHAGVVTADVPVHYSDGTKWDGLGLRGGEVGAFVGYNWRASRTFLIGIEADSTWLNLRNTDYDGTRNASIRRMGSIAARAGFFANSNTLVYGKLGWALIGLDIPSTAYVAPGTGSKDLNGITAGVGIETQLAPHWRFRIEGTYTQALQGYHAFDPVTPLGFDLKPQLVSARLGLIYALGETAGGFVEQKDSTLAKRWSGLYAGGQLGAAISDTREDYFQGPVSGVSWDGFGARGLVGGGFAGFNQQFGPVVTGMELSGTWLGLSNRDTFFDLTWGRVTWMGAIDARAGYLVTPATLLYAKAGWARMGFESTYPNFPTGPKSNATLDGLRLGAGIETQLSRTWSVRVEGVYTKSLEGLEFGLPAQGHSFKPDLVSAELGLAYHF